MDIEANKALVRRFYDEVIVTTSGLASSWSTSIRWSPNLGRGGISEELRVNGRAGILPTYRLVTPAVCATSENGANRVLREARRVQRRSTTTRAMTVNDGVRRANSGVTNLPQRAAVQAIRCPVTVWAP